MQNQRCAPIGFVNLAVPGTSGAVGFSGATMAGTTATIPLASANLALISVSTGAVLWRDDGIAPTLTAGMPIPTGQWPYFEYTGDLASIKFIGVTGTVSVSAAFFAAVG
jgi:hypothetical protein